MIKVTLEFANTVEMMAFFNAPVAPSTVELVKQRAPKAVAEPVAAVAEPVAAVAEPVAAVAAATSGITYPDLQKVVTKLASVDKAAALAICKSLGADNFKMLKPEQWQKAYDLTVFALAKAA